MRTVKYLITIAAIIAALSACANDFRNPPAHIQMPDLVGIWKAEYAPGVSDTLTLKSDGTFRQVFEDSRKKYVFDSGWQKWSLEQTPEGIIRLHVQGGQYYLEGISIGESKGRKNPENPCLGDDCTWGLGPRLFYDPFADEIVQMVDELMLIVLIDSSQNIILHHVWISSDRGFTLIGGDKEIFFKE
jgi:hypothetical protein